jgi:hypothetical protein
MRIVADGVASLIASLDGHIPIFAGGVASLFASSDRYAAAVVSLPLT